MKALIVDGYNAIFKIPSLKKLMDKSLLEARSEITRLAKEYKRKSGGIDKVYVVFDGKDRYRNNTFPAPKNQVFSRTGQGDFEIIRHVKELSQKYHVEVVTDDNYISNNSRAHKATIVNVSEFESFTKKKKRLNKDSEAKNIDPVTRFKINEELSKHWGI